MFSFDFHHLGTCFFVRSHRVSHHARPPLRTPSWIINLKTLVQRFQVCYAQKHMHEIWHRSFKVDPFIEQDVGRASVICLSIFPKLCLLRKIWQPILQFLPRLLWISQKRNILPYSFSCFTIIFFSFQLLDIYMPVQNAGTLWFAKPDALKVIAIIKCLLVVVSFRPPEKINGVFFMIEITMRYKIFSFLYSLLRMASAPTEKAEKNWCFIDIITIKKTLYGCLNRHHISLVVNYTAEYTADMCMIPTLDKGTFTL